MGGYNLWEMWHLGVLEENSRSGVQNPMCVFCIPFFDTFSATRVPLGKAVLRFRPSPSEPSEASEDILLRRAACCEAVSSKY